MTKQPDKSKQLAVLFSAEDMELLDRFKTLRGNASYSSLVREAVQGYIPEKLKPSNDEKPKNS